MSAGQVIITSTNSASFTTTSSSIKQTISTAPSTSGIASQTGQSSSMAVTLTNSLGSSASKNLPGGSSTASVTSSNAGHNLRDRGATRLAIAVTVTASMLLSLIT